MVGGYKKYLQKGGHYSIGVQTDYNKRITCEKSHWNISRIDTSIRYPRVPEDRPELEHFRDKWIPTAEMIQRLKLAGIHVFPQVDSHKYVSVQSKNPMTEERLYQQMAMTASTMAYSWSKWNAEVANPSQVVFQGCEHLEDEPLLEEDWSLFLVTKLRTTNLKMTEFDDAFSEDYKDGTEFHADLYHMSMEITSDAGKERIRSSNYKFIDSVYTILSSIKVLTYS